MQFKVFMIVIVSMVTLITQGYSKLGEVIDFLQRMCQIFFVLYIFITNLMHIKNT